MQGRRVFGPDQGIIAVDTIGKVAQSEQMKNFSDKGAWHRLGQLLDEARLKPVVIDGHVISFAVVYAVKEFVRLAEAASGLLARTGRATP